MRTLLRDRDFAVLFAGQALSMFGDTALIIVLAIWAKDITGSNAAAGLAILAFVAPAMAGPFVGFLVDRARRRPFLLYTNLAAGLALLPLLAVGEDGPLWLLYAVGFAYGWFSVLHRAGLSGLLQVMVPREQLGAANSLLQTVRMGLRLVGPLVGAGLYAAFGGPAVALLDATTFVLAAASLALLRVREERPPRVPQRLVEEMAAGARFLVGEPELRRVVFALAVALLLIGPIETAFFAVVDEGLGREPSFTGVLMSIEGAGAILGALTAPRLMRKVGQVGLIAAGLLLLGVGVVTLVSEFLVVVVVGSVVFGVGLPWLMIGFSTFLQLRTPPPLMGRVSTATDLIMGVPNTVSIAAGAALIAVVDYRLLLATAAAGLFAAGAFLADHSRRARRGTLGADATTAPVVEPASVAASPPPRPA